MLNKEEFLRLQKLAAISLDDNETEKLGKQLGTIVDFLGKLKEVPNHGNAKKSVYNSLKTISGTNEYMYNKELFDNVEHDKIGNAIVVNSVVDN